MVLKNLEILNLRNYEYVRLDFSNKINIFYGKNAHGKTNLLEAIYFLGITKSHRTSFDVELLMENKDFFRVNGLIENEYNYNLQIDYVKNRKKCFIDGKKTLKMDDFIGKMVEASKGKLDNLRELCSNWLKKAGLNEITLDMAVAMAQKLISDGVKASDAAREIAKKTKFSKSEIYSGLLKD